MRILVFGASGKVGRLFVQKALDKGHRVRAFVRNPAKLDTPEGPNLEIFQGHSTDMHKVEEAVQGMELIVSCLGNVKGVHIMAKSFDNILRAAGQEANPPRCLLITSIGCAGTSWLVKQMLSLFIGRAGFNDYELADERARHEMTVPYMLVRPSGLKNDPEKGDYEVRLEQEGTFMKPIARGDLANFLIRCIEDTQYDGLPGILLGGAR